MGPTDVAKLQSDQKTNIFLYHQIHFPHGFTYVDFNKSVFPLKKTPQKQKQNHYSIWSGYFSVSPTTLRYAMRFISAVYSLAHLILAT